MTKLIGAKELRISIEEVRQYVTLATLQDSRLPRGSKALLIDMMKNAVAVEYDIEDRRDIEIAAIDFMPVHGDEAFAWDIEMHWWMPCHQCGEVAEHQTTHSGGMCDWHYDEALAQEHADLENDDIAAGMRD